MRPASSRSRRVRPWTFAPQLLESRLLMAPLPAGPIREVSGVMRSAPAGSLARVDWAESASQGAVSARIGLGNDESAHSFARSDPRDLTFFDYDADGTWTYDDVSGWRRINAANPEVIVATPDRGAYVGYGPHGVWGWDEVRGWWKLNDVGPESMAFAGGVLFLDYGARGLWSWEQTAGWAKLDAEDPARLFASDAALLVDFPDSGLKSWDPSAGYRAVSPLRPQSVSGVGGSFYLDFGAAGLWLRRLFEPARPWEKLSAYDAEAIAARSGDVTIDFGWGGVWRWSEGAGFAKLDDRNAVMLAIGQQGAFLGFLEDGLYLLTDSGVRKKLNDAIPAEVVASLAATDAWLDYVQYGLWRWTLDGLRELKEIPPRAIARTPKAPAPHAPGLV
ncbi:hypothetical protein [Planctomyces sp. SH-PL62]|uniref:hypothetical protein n=1 Tax=Planctomyces sp. SH-PL62 TaxID=1636152 RepID=UPI00078E7A01|nr:hypothetical protein [Planctomyces sp. SH-PL62]AMV36914.1 hypothetical protein VT85_05750 [Planctomyces sp. SH-PL62]